MKPRAILGGLVLLAALCASPASAQRASEDDAAFERALDIVGDDPAGARKLIEPLADKGDGEALNFLATLIEYGGPDWEPNGERARELREAAFRAGSKTAAMNIAIDLMMDQDADHSRAIDLLRFADTEEKLRAVTAHPWGRAYMFGWGVPQDMKRGVAYLEAFVAQSHDDGMMQSDANYLIGRAYQNGWEVPVDEGRAFDHMRKAADGGDRRAQWHAAMMIIQGKGAEVNEEEAYALVKKSSEAGYTDGMISRAVMLATGQGVEEDDEAARDWYFRAAQEHSAHALRGLGMMLVIGEGGEAYPALGFALLQLAAEAGEENATTLLERFKQDMPPQEDIADARQAWVADMGTPDPVE